MVSLALVKKLPASRQQMSSATCCRHLAGTITTVSDHEAPERIVAASAGKMPAARYSGVALSPALLLPSPESYALL
jgi:hypothetical protein